MTTKEKPIKNFHIKFHEMNFKPQGPIFLIWPCNLNLLSSYDNVKNLFLDIHTILCPKGQNYLLDNFRKTCLASTLTNRTRNDL